MTLDSVPELARRILHLEMELKRVKPSAGTDNAALLKRMSALEGVVARLSKATPTKPQVYTPKPAVRVPKPTDNSLALKLAALEREVERLRVKERPAGGSGVTDHGALTGLSDNDHPQYLLTTGKAADSDKLDGIDSTGFATAGHDHDSDYLGITAKASDSDKLDNIDSTGFVQTSGNQTVGGIKTFTSIPALPATNPTTANQAVRKGFADATYLGISAKAADSDKLDGLDSTAFATAGHDHDTDYLGISAKAADSDKLDGLDSTDFVRDIAYKVSAYRNNTTFTLTTSGTLYAIPLNAEEFDSHSQHDNSTNPERFTCVKAGTYLVTGQVSFTANATGNRDALLRVNGTNYVGQNRYAAMASGSTSVPAFAMVELAVGDYVELIGRQYSGGSLTLYYANELSNHMRMVRLGS